MLIKHITCCSLCDFLLMIFIIYKFIIRLFYIFCVSSKHTRQVEKSTKLCITHSNEFHTVSQELFLFLLLALALAVHCLKVQNIYMYRYIIAAIVS